MAIHHIHMDDATPAALGCGNLFAQTGKIGGKNGWKQLDQLNFSLSGTCRPGGRFAWPIPFVVDTVRRAKLR
jgi:hypothetical protein